MLDLLLAKAAEHRRTLAMVAVVATLASTLVAFLIPKRYQSVVRIMPPEGQNPAAMLAALSGKLPTGLSELAGGMLGIKNPGPLYVDLLRSRTVLDNQVTRFDLQKVYRRPRIVGCELNMNRRDRVRSIAG